MKKLLSILAVSLCCVQMTYAGFSVPRSVYKMDQIEEAKAKAKEKGKALMFIYGDPGTN